MKSVVTALIGFAIVAFAATASAHVVEITTFIPVVEASNEADLRTALESAVDDAVKHAIAFTPTLVTVQKALRVGDRIYLMLLVVDRDGEELMKQLATDEAADEPQPLPQPDDRAARSL